MKCIAIVPAYNEADNLTDLLVKWKNVSVDIDIIVVNDRSTDDTLQLCRRHGVAVIDLPCNLGIGGAVQTGYKYAARRGYEIAVQVDGDGQHDPAYIADLLKPIVQGSADLVVGSRYIRYEGFQSTYLRRLGIKYFAGLIRLLTKRRITDPTSGFRACNRQVIEWFAERYPADYPEPESIVALLRRGMRVEEVPVVMKERVAGRSSIRSYRSVYYLVKVSLALLVDKLRRGTGVMR